eukprot:767285-Hanusia_phi.AAC.1
MPSDDERLRAAIQEREKQVLQHMSRPSAALKAALADPPYGTESPEVRVRMPLMLVLALALVLLLMVVVVVVVVNLMMMMMMMMMMMRRRGRTMVCSLKNAAAEIEHESRGQGHRRSTGEGHSWHRRGAVGGGAGRVDEVPVPGAGGSGGLQRTAQVACDLDRQGRSRVHYAGAR